MKISNSAHRFLLIVFFLITCIYNSSAVTCSVDTLNYALNKSSAFRAITLGATSATSVAQYYRAPQPITVSGFEFYAYASGTPTITLTCEIYLAAADSSPSGAALRSVNITIDSSSVSIYNSVMFPTPVVVSGNYVVVVTNNSPTLNAAIVCNDFVAFDGAGEYYSLGRIAGTWLRGDDIVVGTYIFDADWIIEPYVSYTNVDSVYTATLSVCAGTPVTLRGFALSAVVTDDMYNVNAFIGSLFTNTFGWTFGDTSTIRLNTATVSHTYFIPGTYTVTLFDTIRRWNALPCIATTSLSITVLPSTISSSFTSVSGSLTVPFTNTSTSGVNYTWRFGDGATSTATSPSHTYAAPGRYNVCLLAYNSCDSTDRCDSITVTCPAPATPSSITGPITYCPGEVDTFSVLNDTNATTYTWTTPGWTGTSTTNSIILTAGASAGSISVVASSICGTSAASNLTITLGSAPATPGLISGPTSPCPGDIDTFTIAPVAGASSYTWTAAGWTGTSTSTQIILTAGASAGNISVTANNLCGSSSAQVLTISGGSVPATPGTISGTAIACVGLSYTYYISPVAGATSYVWTTPGWTGSSTTDTITLLASATPGNISVRAVNSCGTGSANTLVITPSSIPLTPGTIAGASTLICPGSTQNLNVPLVSGVTSYLWILPSGWSGTSSTNTISATVGTAGGTVYVSAINSCGTSDSSIISYTLGNSPDTAISIVGPTSICANTTVTYSVAPVSGASSYSWSLPVGWVGASTSNVISVTTGTSSGNVSVATVNACGTSAAISKNVTITALSVSISVSTQSQVPANGSIAVSAPVGGVGPYQFALDAGPFQAGSVFNQVESDTHRVIVRDVNGCTQVFVVFVPSTVGFVDEVLFSNLSIYPNPTSDYLNVNIELKNSSVVHLVLYDLIGNEIIHKNLENVLNTTELIDLSSIARGTYVLKVLAGDAQTSRRVIIQ